MGKTKKLSNSELASFFTQVAMLLSSYAPSQIMETMLQDTKNPSGRELLEQIRDICADSTPLYMALEKTGAFPDYTISMMEMGYRTSRDPEIAKELADYYDRQEAISESVKNAISYPMIMIFMMILVILVLITKVLPIFSQVFEQLGSQMNAFSTSLMNFGSRLSSSSIFLVLIMVVLLAAFIFFSKVPQGQRLLSKFLELFPPTRKLKDSLARGRFASGFAMTYGHMDTYDALDLSAALVENERISEKVAKCKQLLSDGQRTDEALNNAEIFSSFHSRMVAVGFESGDPSTALKKIADDYDHEVDKRIHTIISSLEPTLVIILSLIVGLILLSVILPLMGIMSSIG